ncbi:hypothetical protein [Exiguobacterium sp. s80]|uniref:hypothetical protein n=1 Tax=Exiguobacterium sp. s80 TaxID=2751209 RepID=UPI001BEAC4B2|nr:hypothetical protein [Exiguobacterium sp. s80]
MKRVKIGVMLLCFYAIPFVFLALFEDFKTGTLLGYGLMLVGMSSLAFVSQRVSHVGFVILGNLISFAVSYYALGSMGAETYWEGYFKPLTSGQLLILVSVVNVVPQFIAILVAVSLRRKKITSKRTDIHEG